LDDALNRLDAEREHFAEEAAVAAFVTVRDDLVVAWRSATGKARGPLEHRERALLAELADVRARLRGMDATRPLLESTR
jgi:hypothetical protein